MWTKATRGLFLFVHGAGAWPDLWERWSSEKEDERGAALSMMREDMELFCSRGWKTIVVAKGKRKKRRLGVVGRRLADWRDGRRRLRGSVRRMLVSPGVWSERLGCFGGVWFRRLGEEGERRGPVLLVSSEITGEATPSPVKRSGGGGSWWLMVMRRCCVEEKEEDDVTICFV
ncbi:hypothetical protein HAX54_037995 [Datura stramonium]|uniref:Uncharacterized protein n=1 Tax=Datura stramonium TaxID=4076 RepID=A0ABS8VJ67_DATST|nr:hypothetical protein [Datura stramonium]